MVVADESHDAAAQFGHTLTTAHMLLCMFTIENQAAAFLRAQGVSGERLVDAIARKPTEPPDAWDRILRRGREVASVSGTQTVSTMHVLVAMASFVDSAAHRLLSELPVDLARLRSLALAAVQQSVEEPADATLQMPGLRRTETAGGRDLVAITSQAGPSLPPAPYSPPSPAGASGPATAQRGQRPARAIEPVPAESTSESSGPATNVADPPTRSSLAAELREPDDVRKKREERARAELERIRQQRMQKSLAARVFGQKPIAAQPPSNHTPVQAAAAPTAAAPRPAVAPVQASVPKSQLRARFTIRDTQFPLLARLGRNLTLLAVDGELDAVIGRGREIEQLIDVLNKRRANNPVLVGDPGVGKTAVVEGLARRIAGLEGEVPAGIEGRIVVELEASRMVSGTGLRGSFAARMQALKAEVARARGQVIVFLDELHHWIGMGAGGDGASDGAGELKTALARGEFPCIGATTFDEYRRFIESDPAFERRFQIVRVDEPSAADALEILRGARPAYVRHHNVEYDDAALEAVIRLTARYLPDRRLPDKALAALDLAGSRARRLGRTSVDAQLAAAVVAEQAGLPPDKVLMLDAARFVGLAAALHNRIVGHADVIERVASVLRRNHAGFVSGRPIGSFLLLGPTGVGKTETAKAVAHALFDDGEAIVRLDMTEYMEAHSVARLIGAPPGYVGHEAGGQLTEAVRRRPYQVVLLDEIEKAHPDVLNILIQLLDEGRLTDSRGRTVDFANTVVFMTSNLGSDESLGRSREKRIGFGSAGVSSADRQRALDSARGHFRPELWNRIDETLVYSPLTRDDVAAIATLLLRSSSRRLAAERSVAFSWDDELVPFLIENGGFDAELGARPMRRTIERLVEAPIADYLLANTVTGSAKIRVSLVDGTVVLVPSDT